MSQSTEIFKLRKANERINEARTCPIPKMLFGEFWLENELCILFADTGKGKSILAVQIAESIARGEAIMPMKLTAPAQKVVYFDFELSAKQFEMRYAADAEEGEDFLKGHYKFSNNFYSVEIDADSECPEDFRTFEEYLRASLGEMIRCAGAKVVIIDNITYLRGANDTARHAIPLMRELKKLKKELGLSILVLAHTPKRDMGRELTVNDLQGSKVLSNFADNVFAIGQSGIEANFRYVKHIKPRSTEMLYDTSNVLVGEIRKWKKNFLAFKFYRFSPESDHLVKELNPLVQERIDIVSDMSAKVMSQREIAAKLGISVGSVNRYLQMTRSAESYSGLDDGFGEEEEDLPADWPEDPEERFQAFLKMYKIPDPRGKKEPEDGEKPTPADAGADVSKEALETGENDEVEKDEDPIVQDDLKGLDAGRAGESENDAGPNETPGVEDGPPPVRHKKEWEDIQIGDIVRGRDGRPRKR